MARETVLITGASSGIGLELAKLFAADKSDLVLVARNKAALEKLEEELQRDHGVQVLVEPNDLGVTDVKSVASIGYRGFRRGKVLVIPGFRNKLGTFAVRLGPRLVVRKIVKRLQS
jgi:short-subunit dehydrogenase